MTIPYGQVTVARAALLFTAFLLVGPGLTVSKLRKRAGIEYLQAYVDKAQEASQDAKVFNCAQRSHQNALGNIPIIYTTARVPCIICLLSAISYTRGYITGDPEKASPCIVSLVPGHYEKN
ncbi:hypothetical protein CPB84DRAFT_1820530 [Gymnopilus junonius]|uniref:Uncharacterized protein n=1 Tax=Gymnopilus junonius TaxID=109634 RepID=A0A9P5TUE5_GYMJU|nr:hypothetical protein CPB84DRAFT_1820530 [Gymnopilus junonius]